MRDGLKVAVTGVERDFRKHCMLKKVGCEGHCLLVSSSAENCARHLDNSSQKKQGGRARRKGTAESIKEANPDESRQLPRSSSRVKSGSSSHCQVNHSQSQSQVLLCCAGS